MDLAAADLVFKAFIQYLIPPNLAHRRRAPQQILRIHKNIQGIQRIRRGQRQKMDLGHARKGTVEHIRENQVI